MVEGLKGDLTKLEPILEQASKDAEKLLKQVEIDKADAAKVKEKVRERLFFSLRTERTRFATHFSGSKKNPFEPVRSCKTFGGVDRLEESKSLRNLHDIYRFRNKKKVENYLRSAV